MALGADSISEARVSRSEAIARLIEREILDDRVERGTRLGTKQELRDRFGVAVATVNEAIRMLEMRGLVEARPGPGGGVFVASPPADVRLNHLVLRVRSARANVEDTLAVRNALELLVAKDAAEHVTDADIADLGALVEEMQEVVDDPDAFLRANWALHRRISEIGHNLTLRSIYCGLLDVLEDRLEHVEPDEVFRASQNVKVHRELVAAIASRDEAKIARAVRRHDPLARTTP